MASQLLGCGGQLGSVGDGNSVFVGGKFALREYGVKPAQKSFMLQLQRLMLEATDVRATGSSVPVQA